MQVNIKYFGMLTEVTHKQEEWIRFEDNTIGQLIDQLYISYPKLKDMDFKVAVNHEITDLNSELNSGEVALLPPFSGG
ncbi:MAG: MoaD/ThiS family protein [Bacteroidia bacterium]|nr:MoaD/ThiS family protein [Bacteroidia bacterium]MBT8268542.1 MoaD/ThiS family protein [Bacteroidia bacterium]NNL80597.1 MoaD/ThiS family protein [Flavobacteriaceae bacterium]